MMLINPINFPAISMISGTFNNVVKLASDLSISGFDATDIKQYTKLSALSRQMGLMFSEKELTTGGQFKYNNEWSNNAVQNALTFILGYSEGKIDYELAKKSIEKVQKKDQSLLAKVIDSIFSSQSMSSAGYGETKDIITYPFISEKDKLDNKLGQFFIRMESKKNVDALMGNIVSKSAVKMSAEEYIRNAYNGFEVEISE